MVIILNKRSYEKRRLNHSISLISVVILPVNLKCFLKKCSTTYYMDIHYFARVHIKSFFVLFWWEPFKDTNCVMISTYAHNQADEIQMQQGSVWIIAYDPNLVLSNSFIDIVYMNSGIVIDMNLYKQNVVQWFSKCR